MLGGAAVVTDERSNMGGACASSDSIGDSVAVSRVVKKSGRVADTPTIISVMLRW